MARWFIGETKGMKLSHWLACRMGVGENRDGQNGHEVNMKEYLAIGIRDEDELFTMSRTFETSAFDLNEVLKEGVRALEEDSQGMTFDKVLIVDGLEVVIDKTLRYDGDE